MPAYDFVEITLPDLETLAVYAANPFATDLRLQGAFRNDTAKAVEAMRSTKELRIISREAEAMLPKDRWLIPLSQLTPRHQAEIAALLRPFASRYGVRFEPDKVLFVT